MPQRNSIDCKQSINTTLRRSPRLLQTNHIEPEHPKTPKPKSSTNRLTQCDTPSSSSTQKVFQKKAPKRYPEENPKKVKASDAVSKSSSKTNTGSRRSARFDGGVKGFSCLRRSPRFSGNSAHNTFKQEGLSDAGNVKLGIDLHKQSVGKPQKRVTRSSTKDNANGLVEKTGNDESNGNMSPALTDILDKGDLSDAERAKVGASSCDQSAGQLRKKRTFRSVASSKVVVGGRERNVRDIDKGRKEIGVKRKRNQAEEGCGTFQGWTNDQEIALQRAYFAAKPTPHFWKKVAKLVPGKSAQDCFDKIHSDHLTPAQPGTRLRANITNSSSFSLSASNFLKSAEPKIKRRTCSKQKRHLAQKTVRRLLQKHYHVDQDYEADLFSVLESTLNISTQASQQDVILSTPECGQGKRGLLKKYQGSSSARKKHISRLSGSLVATLVSPPVLKQVKNKALHEKYIDQLHCREAKRKAASARTAKSIRSKEGRKESLNQGAIEAAKNALVSDARDVISRFQHLNANVTSNLSDFDDDDDGVDSDNDESEEGS
ncbi:uncharacterized protein LOC132286534 [Cornus florida]|uniref:uncharacterized protein LOC132286534 n=1 Tax=Cornus florida TaxID=4283 RepID=UPI00289B039B|nr:uncharacterized protein LOC132286534 [Cornus florida]